MGGFHPESPARLAAIRELLDGMAADLDHIAAPLAEKHHLGLAHDPDYVETVFRVAPQRGMIQLDPDTGMNSFTLAAARRAAGAVIAAIDLVMSGKYSAAFCSVRPPGHHALRSRAMGFCIFNNIAVGAAYALSHHPVGKVAIVDFDVHHGNGTEDIFSDNPSVMLCSSFQHPFYPWSGAETESDHIINVPLPAGTDGRGFRAAYERRIFPALESFRPELVLISAGFDAHAEDPLAELRLTEADYNWVTANLRDIAARHAGGRMVSSLEGGYSLPALGRSVAAHLQALMKR
jgi:acetoin utilization deacetylase AcuC-like enzyme